MAKSRLLQRIGLLLGAIGVGVAYQRYEHEKDETLRRLRLGSRLLHTKCGVIEYAVAGEGHPFLMLHGSGGGYQQGLLLSQIIDPQTFQILASLIPNAQFVAIEGGTHFMVGTHRDTVASAIETMFPMST